MTKKPRGRPPHTPEQREASRKASKAKFKNVSLDADLVGMLNEAAEKLAEELGFRPTHSQTLKTLIKRSLK